MEEERSFLFSLLVSWGPIILLIVVFVGFMKKVGVDKNKSYMSNTTEKLNEQVEEIKKVNMNLEKIYQVLNEKADK